MSSVEFTWNNFVAAFERYWSYGTLVLTVPTMAYTLSQDTNILSYYGIVSYRINNSFEIGYSYGEFYNDDGWTPDVAHPNRIQAWHKESSFLFRWDINSNWIFKMEYCYIDGAGRLLPTLNSELASVSDDLDRYWHLYMAKLSYNF